MSQPFAILIDATPLCRKTDGVGRYTQDLVIHLAKKYPEREIILLGFIGDKLMSDKILTISNVRFYKLPIIRKAYSFLYSRLVRIPVDILLPRFDVYIGTNFIRFPYITSHPSLIAIHDMAYVRFPETIERKNLAHLTKHVPLTMEEDNTVIATSAFTKRELEELYPDHNEIFNVSNAIDTPFWTPSGTKREKYILAVGTLEPRKNFSALLEAYTSLPEKVQMAHPLVIVGGSGWGESYFQKSKHITFTGYVDDKKLIELYRKARLFVLPSLYEGFGIPVLEALSTNTPVICADIPPLRDIANKYATYFDPKSSKNIADTLQKELAKKPRSIDFNPQAFAWDRSIESLERAIQFSLRK